jgi:hypothetical protein
MKFETYTPWILVPTWSALTPRDCHSREVGVATHAELIIFIFYSIQYERQRGEDE